ncbi:MAG: DUF1801 domain-containing protein [Pirellulales bacterium]
MAKTTSKKSAKVAKKAAPRSGRRADMADGGDAVLARKTGTTREKSPSELISEKIADLGDWRGDVLRRVRKLIKQAVPEIVEEWKWRGTPVWSHNGLVCTGESYKNHVKLTFAKGASLKDPAGLFNASMDGNARRAIDIHQGDKISEPALRDLIRAAVALNSSGKKKNTTKKAAKPTLLAGGNPQIAKADGDAPVQAYIAAMPAWKRDVGRRLDAIIQRTVPSVRKAVKWNSPLYGVEGQGWFLSFHCFTKYVKVAFFRGTSLRPLPPGESKTKNTRYLDIREDDPLDEARFAAWVKQASQMPGERM